MSEGKHTRAPWRATGTARKDSNFGGYATMVHGPEVARVAKVYGGAQDSREECEANAKLIIAAPDHALLLAAMAKGAARWDPFNLNTLYADTNRGELVVDRLRYGTQLDDFGCPALNDALRVVLGRVAP